MSQNLLYFFSALAQSIAAIIAFSIAAIIFYKRKVEEEIENNVVLYLRRYFPPENERERRIAEREGHIARTNNLHNMSLQTAIWKDDTSNKLNDKERKSKKMQAIENIEFYLNRYRCAKNRFWWSFGLAVLTIILSLCPLCCNFCAKQSFLCILASGSAAMTIAFVVFLLVNVFKEPKQKSYLKLLKKDVENRIKGLENGKVNEERLRGLREILNELGKETVG